MPEETDTFSAIPDDTCDMDDPKIMDVRSALTVGVLSLVALLTVGVLNRLVANEGVIEELKLNIL